MSMLRVKTVNGFKITLHTGRIGEKRVDMLTSRHGQSVTGRHQQQGCLKLFDQGFLL